MNICECRNRRQQNHFMLSVRCCDPPTCRVVCQHSYYCVVSTPDDANPPSPVVRMACSPRECINGLARGVPQGTDHTQTMYRVKQAHTHTHTHMNGRLTRHRKLVSSSSSFVSSASVPSGSSSVSSSPASSSFASYVAFSSVSPSTSSFPLTEV